MADPLSIAASVAGLLSLSLQVIKIIRKDITTVSNAPKEASELVEKLQTLTDVLQFLQEFVDRNATLALPASTPTKPLVLTTIIDKCSGLLKKLESHSKELRGGGIPGAKRRALWFLDKELLIEAGVEVQRFVTLFAQCKSFEGM
jgi:hypothetical protein